MEGRAKWLQAAATHSPGYRVCGSPSGRSSPRIRGIESRTLAEP
jgi:hypothetical protein